MTDPEQQHEVDTLTTRVAYLRQIAGSVEASHLDSYRSMRAPGWGEVLMLAQGFSVVATVLEDILQTLADLEGSKP